MHIIIDALNLTEYKGLKVSKLLDINAKEIIRVSIEAGSVFPTHISTSDATLIVLEGAIVFHINDQEFDLKQLQIFQFPKEEEHWVKAIEDSKFLLIR